jgi:hypothetical protein
MKNRILSINSSVLALAAIALSHSVVLIKGIFLPYPEFFIYPYLTNIGLTPYSQILDQHFPGLMFFPINLNNLGFLVPSDFRILQIGVVAITHVLLFKTAKSIIKSDKKALLANILYFVMHPFLEGTVVWIDNFVPLLLLPAFYFLSKETRKREAFVAGLFLGCSVLLKQVLIPLVFIVTIYVFFFRKKDNIKNIFILGTLIPALALLVFILQNGILNDFIYWAGTFNLTAYKEMGRKYATFGQLVAISTIYAPAILISLYGFISRKRVMLLLSIFLWSTIVFAYARFDYVHLQPSLPFAILLIISFFSLIPEKLRGHFFILYLIPLVWVSSRYFGTSIGSEVKFFGGTEYKIASKIEELTDPGDTIYMFGTLPHMYQITKTRPPGDIFVFQFPWFMKVAEERVLGGIVNDPPKVVVTQKSATIDGASLFDYMQSIDGYIFENYEKIDEVGDIEILVLKDASRN